ncbi:MAG: alpha/beta hydrolase [Nostoc sp. NMS7]|uniref:alpha/beta fold hydrolase n=1 Tax=Nostoc sp. NMS7 TaxID=2815391 RepID=UPI0025F567D2|nr:alpha/beta hydrolase [Nostoc sp. NMS7]MBN3950057.1 alpha/beta hydrolase [Nostoc sp. NMS7]
MISNRSNVLIPGFVSETINIDGVNIHYKIGGDPNGQPILLWHGFLSTGYAWRSVMSALAQAGYAVLVPDMRGYGDSDKPAGTKGYDARALAEEFRALVLKIGFGAGQPLTLVAHDMGAPPALLWAIARPEEIAGLLYIEAPVMLSEILTKIIAYTPEAMKEGSMWWWILPLAPDVPERLVIGNERAFLTWFYERSTFDRNSIEPETVDEILRTFSSLEGVLGAMGVYRAAFVTIEQTAPLAGILGHKVKVPIVALGGDKGLGRKVGEMVNAIAKNVEQYVIPNCGHFVPEECPDEVVRHVLTMTNKVHQTATSPSIRLRP